MARIYADESDEQETVVQWAELTTRRWPALELLYHVPNGGKRGIAEAARFRRMGVKSGVPDLVLPVANGGYHGLYIELKAHGGSVSPTQEIWLKRLRQQGYAAFVCVGADEAIHVITKYLEGGAI
jgi:VRR-NUC domain.